MVFGVAVGTPSPSTYASRALLAQALLFLVYILYNIYIYIYIYHGVFANSAHNSPLHMGELHSNSEVLGKPMSSRDAEGSFSCALLGRGG